MQDVPKSGLQEIALPIIYRNLKRALCNSMIYGLSKGRFFLQIGSSTCIDARTLGGTIFDFLEFSPATRGSTAVAFNARWLASGSLLFFIYRNTVARLCTLAHALSIPQKSSPLKLGDRVLLSPSGMIGRYQGVEGTQRLYLQHNSIAATKAWVSAWLMRRGVTMPQHLKWVYLLVTTDNDHQDELRGSNTDQLKAGLNLWPAHLCLCRDTVDTATRLPEQNLIRPLNSAFDPVERAESWFRAKGARLEALEINRQKDLAKSELTRQLEHTDNEEGLQESQQRFSQEVTPRDVSGIYPTPPDGLPMTTYDTSAPNDLQPSVLDSEMHATTMDEDINPSYEENGDDDLFGEVDIDMFATNGLTEDDFNFFDEPRGHGHASTAFRSESFPSEDPVAAATVALPSDRTPNPVLRESQDHGANTLLKASIETLRQSPSRS